LGREHRRRDTRPFDRRPRSCLIQVGPSGSGHFVKMVHNGIEYGDMQLICEVYHIMKDILNMSNDEIADVSVRVRSASSPVRSVSTRSSTSGTRERWTRFSSRSQPTFSGTRRTASTRWITSEMQLDRFVPAPVGRRRPLSRAFRKERANGRASPH
jgi:6-phosphogluconate dehydrogenase (decarboxylating)